MKIVYWNYTDKCANLAKATFEHKEVVRCCMKEFSMPELAVSNLRNSRKRYLIKASLGILLNVVRLYNPNSQLIREDNGVEKLVAYYKSTYLTIKAKITILLSYCINEEENDKIVTGFPKSNVNVNQLDNVHHPRNLKIKDYFDHYENELENDIKSGNVDGESSQGDSHGHSSKSIHRQHNGNMIPMDRYTDEAFERMIRQLNHKDISGFEFMAESTNVTIYRQPKGNAGLYQYKLYAILPHATPDEIAAVFLDNEYRLVWDEYVTELYPVQLNEKGPDVIYFNVDYPWPLANRDYVYARETRKQIRDGKEYITIVMHSVLEDTVPLVNSVIRVNDYHQSLAMAKYGEKGTTALIEYYDDPKGAVPSWLVNWAAKTGVPAFLNDLQRACQGLRGFLEKKNKPMLTIAVH